MHPAAAALLISKLIDALLKATDCAMKITDEVQGLSVVGEGHREGDDSGSATRCSGDAS
jgi:hypothetical protein